MLQLVDKLGNQIRLPHSKGLGKGLNELRGRQHGIRMFYMFRPGQRVVVLGGMVKKRDTIPPATLERMRERLADVKRND